MAKKMAKIRTDRLLKLADFLETVPPGSFDIEGWLTKEPTKPEGKKQGECGFAGCAVGWAVHSKLFRGLHFVRKTRWNGTVWFDVAYAAHESFDAASELFALWDMESPENECATAAEYLFGPEEYEDKPSPKQVAKRIRSFVATSSSSA